MDEKFLNEVYQGDKDFWFLSKTGKIADYWISKCKYPDWKDFLPLFTEHTSYKTHTDHGGAELSYNKDGKYVHQVDKDHKYEKFLKNELAPFRFESIEFEKCWWIKYPVGAFSGLHTHLPLRKLTSIMFLDTLELLDDKPLAGKLQCVTQNPVTGELIGDINKCIAGDVIIMDGKVYHGVYPTLEERRAFVCDFIYEVKFD
ncbi:MAG: hypothetical protein CMA64_06390 [Euryarchaeota archaeon]|nr:hypothetical protein [Euryarchaeota archaeon]